jgi:hypothetical protein
MKNLIKHLINEMTSGKLSSYIDAAKPDYVSKINTDRTASIKRSKSVELARRKVIEKLWTKEPEKQLPLKF